MTLDQLRIFVAVADHGHMTRAAATLNLTQSAVSGAIRTLESRYSVMLFDRVGRNIELSRHGREFLGHARSVLAAADVASASLAAIAGIQRGMVSVYASQTIGAYWLPSRLVDFRDSHPGFEVKVTLGNSEEVCEAVSAGIADIGFAEGDSSTNSMHSEVVGFDDLKIVVGATHFLAGKAHVTNDELKDLVWVLRERGSGTRSVFEHALKEQGIDTTNLNVLMELPSNEAIREVVECGIGATALSNSVIQHAVRQKTLAEISTILIRRPFVLLSNPNRSMSQATRAFAAHMRSAHTPKPSNP